MTTTSTTRPPGRKAPARPGRVGPRRARALGVGVTATLLALGVAVLATRSGSDSSEGPRSASPAAAGSAEVDGQAAAFSVPTLSGSTFVFPTGKPTALFFTASSCGSCLPKAEAFDRIHREVGDRVAILGVDVDPTDSESAFREWIGAAGNPGYDFAIDRNSELVRVFGVRALSTVVIADASGRVVFDSYTEGDEATFRAALARAGLA